MKKNFTRFIAFTAFIAITSNSVIAQTEQFKISDLDPYYEAYLQPFAKAMAVSMSGGWTHTAKVHSTLGFDITLNASVVQVPDADKIFNASDIKMDVYSMTGTAPTISASDDLAKPTLSRDISMNVMGQNINEKFEFDGMGGLNLGYGGMVAIQGGIGLPKGIELIFRFVPDISSTANNAIPGDGIALEKTGMWGFGVKHDIKQWIPVINKVPILQISGLFTYSKFNTGFSGTDFSITPNTLNATSSLPDATWENQKFEMEMSSITGSLLVGANIPVFQPFIGLGFNSATFNGGFIGNYPIVDFTANTDIANPGIDYSVTDIDVDPIDVEAKATNFNFKAGARLKLGPIVLYYTMTVQEYMMHSGGLAVTLR